MIVRRSKTTDTNSIAYSQTVAPTESTFTRQDNMVIQPKKLIIKKPLSVTKSLYESTSEAPLCKLLSGTELLFTDRYNQINALSIFGRIHRYIYQNKPIPDHLLKTFERLPKYCYLIDSKHVVILYTPLDVNITKIHFDLQDRIHAGKTIASDIDLINLFAKIKFSNILHLTLEQFDNKPYIELDYQNKVVTSQVFGSL